MEASDIVIDVEAALSESMQRKLDTLWGQPNEIESFTIFRVPRNIHKNKENIFKPCVVSIGPFYRGVESLRTMEEKKWRFLRDLLSRGDHISLARCISEMKALEEKTRRCYSETVDLNSKDFIEMILLDGCFVLEYFLKWRYNRWNSISEVGWNSTFINTDLLLLENQIPFFIVEKLYEIVGVQEEDNFVAFLAHVMANGPIKNSNYPDPPSSIQHLIHLCYHCVVPNPDIPIRLSSKSACLPRIKDLFLGFLLWVLTFRFPSSDEREPSVMAIPCATELQDAGVKFIPKRDPCHIFDISFTDGVLEIPRLKVTDHFQPVIMNLIAFEQSKLSETESNLTSFAIFLDSLVNTERDAMTLQQCGIIENCLSSEEELTCFFNQVSEGTILKKDHFLGELFKEVNRYSESNWNRNRAKLHRDYFGSPWATASFIAASVLLVLTCVQSFFAVYAYFLPPS